uniref:Uncharacterized protein n=1 Tax=Arundo donax TaxID=35708 RepID=A0A0A9A5W8_ARUDO
MPGSWRLYEVKIY